MGDEKHRRVSIGFHGGQVMAVRLAPDSLSELRRALEKGGWHELVHDEGSVAVDLGRVVYVNVDSDEPRVGFGV
jgi:hypothetical protein